MNIEKVDDLADEIGNWLGCYGCCKAAEKGEDCEDTNPFCCRIGLMMWLPDRIRNAVKNEELLESIGK